MLIKMLYFTLLTSAIAASANTATNDPFTAVLQQGNKTVTSVTPDVRIQKPTELHPETYYVTGSGKKIHFQVRKNVYLLTPKPTQANNLKAELSQMETSLKTAHGKELEVLQDKQFRGKIRVNIRQGKNVPAALGKLRSRQDVAYISPVLVNKRGAEVSLSPGVVIRIRNGGPKPDDYLTVAFASYGLHFVKALSFTNREFLFEYSGLVEDPTGLFQTVRQVMELPDVEWAEPNFEAVPIKYFTPNDTLYPNQWHLNNTGQNGGQVDADVDAPEGWDLSRGAGTVIAVYDDAVQVGHPDFTIWNNPGETGAGKETNGIDDDGNGFIDDYRGWDFTDGDNDPSPAAASDNHGTAVAGVAGAHGNNGVGVTGSATNAQLLAVRMSSGLCSEFGNAMRYAARYADVVNNSWGIGGCESEIDSAIADGVNGLVPDARRGSKGTPILFATGNSASGWKKLTLTGFPVGTFNFEWEFIKNASIAQGYDTMWLDDITWPGGSVTGFEGSTSLPAGFSTTGNANWTVVSDGIHARGATGNSARAGAIGDSQTTRLLATRTVGTGNLTFWVWVSSEQAGDEMKFYVNGTLYFSFSPGQYGHVNEVGYPSSNPNTISIGASNDGGPSGLEERSNYSQFGPKLDVLAPSNGGYQGITTTDRTDADGYDPTNYTSGFGGTSSATPLAAGVVADIIAIYPHITANQVREALRHGADQIGPYVYDSDRNDYYGHGRVNLLNSLEWVRDNNLAFDCDLNDKLVANRWALIGSPCTADAPGSVTSTLGDDLDIPSYASDWILWEERSPGANNYVALATGSEIDPGVGYWIKSLTGSSFLNGGALDVAGTTTPVASDVTGCPSANGCFVIPLISPQGGDTYEWNLLSHPLAYPVDWAEARILVDGTTVYTPSGAEGADIVSATYQAWSGSAYEPHDDSTPLVEGTLQPSQGIWVKTLPGAIGHTIELLIPATPSLKTSQQIDKKELPLYAQIVNWLVPTAHADESMLIEIPGRREQAIGYAEREAKKAASLKRQREGTDWYVRLTVEAPEEQLKDAGNALGQLADSIKGYDRHDLRELPPFAAPYLTIVFPHEDWGEQAGDYASDYHGYRFRDRWEFEIRTDKIGREVSLCWQGPAEVLDRSVLIDLSTKQKYRLIADDLNDCLPLNMDNTVKRFRWQYRQ